MSKNFKLNPNAPMFIPSKVSKSKKDIDQKVNTYWEPNDIEDVPSKHREFPVEIQQAQCNALENLKKRRVFKTRLKAFLEKEYCVSEVINPEKGCRIELDIRGISNEGLAGKKKKDIGFWFNYKQDGFIYRIVYECDDIKDPKTGWFFKNICDDECGGTCSLFECATAYQRE